MTFKFPFISNTNNDNHIDKGFITLVDLCFQVYAIAVTTILLLLLLLVNFSMWIEAADRRIVLLVPYYILLWSFKLSKPYLCTVDKNVLDVASRYEYNTYKPIFLTTSDVKWRLFKNVTMSLKPGILCCFCSKNRKICFKIYRQNKE